MASSTSRSWLFAVAVFLVVSVFMLLPLSGAGALPKWPHFDKLVHGVAWLALAIGAWPALRASWPRARWLRALMIVMTLGCWGVAIELLQAFVPHRSSDLWDALADVAGAAVGVLVMIGVESLREARDGDVLAEVIEP